MESPSQISEFYKDRSIFITGATGFMGKVLVEKLLRSCPGIKRLYLLMRPSKGKDVQTRLRELLTNEVFDVLRQEHPEALDKVTAIAGDITSPGFGISATDLEKIYSEVSIIFNSAATVKFDEELKAAVKMNVLGPRQLLQICRKMKHLEALIHVSTAYNNLDQDEIHEQIYPSTTDTNLLIDMVSGLDEELVKKITKELVGTCPNTYTYTKALAERMLLKECGDLPLAIVRPSIVTAAKQEPIPGWVDNLNGPTGFISGVGKGFMRSFYINSDLVGDIVPVEYPINLMIAVAWHTALQKSKKSIVVYNCSTGHLNPLTWGRFRDVGFQVWMKYPTKEMMWYPCASFTMNTTVYKIEQAIFHYLPAYCIDAVCYLMGKRVKWVRLYDRAHRAIACLDFFTTHQWRFISKNPIQLLDHLSDSDRRTFDFDVRKIDWNSYIETYILGARRFILKDDPSTLPQARKNLTRLFILKMVFRVLLVGLLVLFMSYLLQHSPWEMNSSFDFISTSDNFTFIGLHDVEKESGQAMAPYLANGIQS